MIGAEVTVSSNSPGLFDMQDASRVRSDKVTSSLVGVEHAFFPFHQ